MALTRLRDICAKSVKNQQGSIGPKEARVYTRNVSAHIENALVKATDERCLPRKRQGVIMGIQLRSGPARYTLGVGVAAVLAIGTGGLVTAASAAASPASSARHWHCHTSITKEDFGTANSGPYGGDQTVFRYTMTNSNCMQVRVITYGATVQSITVPDQNGRLANVALGFKTLADYVNLDSPPPTSPNFGGPYFGETIGRYANRIGGASFKLQGNTYTLPVNNGPNTLHGGFVGWGNRVWQNPTTTSGRRGVSLTMTLVSPNGDEGSGLLPGTKV